ncbi:MAG: OFA family MFS transporter [Verrucomicrobiota bacterium]|jgi:OFA family oxalate/formate antiporter-like MFS transporter
MTDTARITKPPTANRGWLVTFAGMGVNLALGVLYSWSVVSKGIPKEWNWTEAEKSLPYSVACLVFSLIMVPAGRMQDRIGPRIVATVGGVMVGLGMILASFTTSPIGYILGFGLLAGAGIGCGYASTTPPAVKWFAAARTGMIAGLVVAGFGLASVYVAPLAQALIGSYGVPTTMLALGIGFLVVVVGLSQLLMPPPKGYIPAGTVPPAPGAAAKRSDFTPGEVLKTWQFYVLWFMYVCGAGAGLMIISKLAKIVDVQAGLKLGFVLVAVLAVGNGGGRIIAGTLSDKIGRKATLFICFVLQAILIMLLSQATTGSVLGTTPALVVLSALIGANYGANLALFPSVTKDYYGLKNFGVNYGLVFTAWGLGGFMLSLLAGKVYDQTQTFTFAYYCSAVLLVAAAAVTFLVKPPPPKSGADVPEPVPAK